MGRDPVCMGCGQPTGPRPRLNRLLDGSPCPSCRDRLMESIPPALPSAVGELSLEEWAEEGDDPPDDYLEGA